MAAPPRPPPTRSQRLIQASGTTCDNSITNLPSNNNNNNNNNKQFESEALKRQAERSSLISSLEGRLALFHARLA
jgi:hypothetical protein